MDDREQAIRNRAHALWESQGRPDGQHHAHWAQAESEIDAGPADGNEGLPTPDTVGLPTPDTVSAIDVDPEPAAPTPVKPVAASAPIKPTRTKKTGA